MGIESNLQALLGVSWRNIPERSDKPTRRSEGPALRSSTKSYEPRAKLLKLRVSRAERETLGSVKQSLNRAVLLREAVPLEYRIHGRCDGSDGLRLFMSRPVDAIVLDYELGLLDGGVVAAEIKRVKPRLPIVMVTEGMDLPEHVWKSVAGARVQI